MPENNPQPITPEEEEQIAAADQSAKQQAARLLGKKSASKFFDYMEAKRSGEEPPSVESDSKK